MPHRPPRPLTASKLILMADLITMTQWSQAMTQNRLLAIMLAVVATLVLGVGGLSAILLLSGEGDSGPTGVTTGLPTSGVDGSSSSTRCRRGGPLSSRLRLASGDPVTMDPHLAGDSLSAEYIVEIFGGLRHDHPAGLRPIALDIAESFEVSDDNLTYTFTLRTGRAVPRADAALQRRM